MSDTSTEQAATLEDEVALIVGGNAVGGNELALALARLGSDVAIIYYAPLPKAAYQTKRNIETLGRRCLLISSAELGDSRLGGAVELVRQKLGRLNLFIDFSTERGTVAPVQNNQRLEASDLFPHYHVLAKVMQELISAQENSTKNQR